MKVSNKVKLVLMATALIQSSAYAMTSKIIPGAYIVFLKEDAAEEVALKTKN